MEALGAIDECNSTLGMAIALIPADHTLLAEARHRLETVQHTLFDLGAAVATPLGEASERKKEKTRFGEEATLALEQWMDEMDAELPPLKTFILPSGHPAGATLHLARTVCRGAERQIIPLCQSGACPEEPLKYLNRLSDFLFMAARFVNHKLEAKETCWVPHQ